MNWSQLLSPHRIDRKKQSGGPSRSAFEQDYDRIVFSHPFRRLQDKTQVHPLPEHDFVHTRLTHSLEVSSVGRSLGKKVGEVVLQRNNLELSLFDFGAVVAAAALTHDLGNPPFGHTGEDAISGFFKNHPVGQSFKSHVSSSAWEDLINFEGNAQGFRILNKNRSALGLTCAALGAFTKYPCPSFFEQRDKKKRSQKKYGFFQSEQEIFRQVADEVGLVQVYDAVWCRHPLAFLVEAADDICYSIIDLEDGCSLGLVSLDDTVELLAAILQEDFKPEKLNKIVGQQQKISVLRAMAINKLTDECAHLFLDVETQMLEGKFDVALVDQCRYSHAMEDIIKVSVNKIYRSREVVEIETAGYEVLPGLLEEFTRAGLALMEGKATGKNSNLVLMMPEECRENIKNNPEDVYTMLREVVDFISGLTDKYAISLYQRIKGFKI